MIAPHVRQTINDLEILIGKMQSTIQVLQAMEDQATPAASGGITLALNGPTPSQMRQALEGYQPPFVKKPRKVRSSNGRSLESRQLSAHIMECARSFARPFKSEELQAKAEIPYKQAGNYLSRWKFRGWARRLGGQLWELTKKFPAAETVPERSVQGDATNKRLFIPGLDKPQLSPQEQFDAAIKERDRANAAGNETLATIAQTKVDRLAKQYGLEV